MTNKTLYKTTIVIWTDYDTESGDCDIKMYDDGIERLAREATNGNAYCSVCRSVAVSHPDQDPDWDGTEFFGVEKIEEEESNV